jgi:hypothetical protein
VVVRNVTSTGFEFQIKEWDYLDGTHASEQVSWMAIEAGKHTLANGQVVVAGSTTASSAASSVNFGASGFTSKPLVLAQVASENQAAAMTERVGAVGTNGFKLSLEQQEANSGTILPETVHWIALEPGSGTGGGLIAGTIDPVTNTATTLTLPGTSVTDHFAFLADLQTIRGSDPATLRLSGVMVDGVSILAQEERSADVEGFHAGESVGYVAMDPGLIYGL